jgi:hypothetical protein
VADHDLDHDDGAVHHEAHDMVRASSREVME